jgi:hypothetical protein
VSYTNFDQLSVIYKMVIFSSLLEPYNLLIFYPKVAITLTLFSVLAVNRICTFVIFVLIKLCIFWTCSGEGNWSGLSVQPIHAIFNFVQSHLMFVSLMQKWLDLSSSSTTATVTECYCSRVCSSQQQQEQRRRLRPAVGIRLWWSIWTTAGIYVIRVVARIEGRWWQRRGRTGAATANTEADGSARAWWQSATWCTSGRTNWLGEEYATR